MDAQTIAQLSSILARISSSDNQVRATAERELNTDWIRNRPDAFLLGLVSLMHSHQDPNCRAFCAILLRRMGLRLVEDGSPETADSFRVHLWMNASAQLRTQIKLALLDCLRVEPDRSVRHKICDTISEVVKVILSQQLEQEEDGNVAVQEPDLLAWDELLPVALELTKAPSADHRESSYLILGAVPALLVGPAQQQFFAHVRAAFLQGLQDPQSTKVRVAALKACVALLSLDTIDSKSRSSLAAEWIIPMASVLIPFHSPETRDEDLLTDGLTAFTELCEPFPKLVRPILKTLVPFLVEICRNKEELDDRTRQSALELLVTLAENAAPMCRKLEAPGFAAQVVPVTLAMMTELEDDADWYTTNDIDDSDDMDSPYIVAEQAMDRFARALGGKHILPPTFAILPAYLGSPDWTHRHAALMCISAIGEGCVKIMEAELGRILEMVLPHLLRDQHPRVRYAACNTIGQMCTDFGPTLQNNFHEKVLMGLCSTMDTVNQPRVQAHGAAALVNFCEHASQESIAPYLDTIFSKITVLLQTNRTYIQEQAITSLATVADAAGDKFSNYYNGVMPVLLNILHSATSKEFRLLRGKAMECASLIALAVGKELFTPHAKDLIDLLVATQHAATDPDDPQISYLLASWARICKVLGQDFVPYLPVVMPSLLASARHKPDFAILDPDENEEEKGFSEEDGWEFLKIEDQKIGIKTTALEEKCTAVEMLICYARELGAGFQPYAEEVLRLVVPMLKFYFHEGVRHAAAAVLPHLFNSMVQAGYGRDKILSLWHEACSALLIVIHDEPDAETLVQFLVAFYETMDVLGPGSLENGILQPMAAEGATEPVKLNAQISNTPLLAYVCRAITGQISEALHRIQVREQQRMDKEMYDPEMEETLQEEEELEDGVLGELNRAVHIVFKTHSNVFLTFFHQGLLSAVSGMLHTPSGDEGASTHSNSPSAVSSRSLANQAKQWSICVFDDLIEFCGARAAWEFRQYFWESMLHGVTQSTSADVRQACCYGLGTLAFQAMPQRSGSKEVFDLWVGSLLDSLNVLFASLTLPWARHPDHAIANENAVAAIGKILHYTLEPVTNGPNPQVPVEQFRQALLQWMQCLPLVEDDEEAPHTYGYLLELLSRQDSTVMENLNLVLKVLVEALACNVLTQSTGQWEGYGTGKEVGMRAVEAVQAILRMVGAEVKAQVWSGLDAGQRQKLATLGFA